MKKVSTTKILRFLVLACFLSLALFSPARVLSVTNNEWVPMDDVPGARILSLALDPTNPQVLYAGLPFGGGVWRSMDGAETWSSCGNNGFPEKADITSLAVDPNNPNHLFAANSRGSEYGLWETTDAGLNWSQTQPGNWGQITGLGTFLYAIKDDTVQSYNYTSGMWSTIQTPTTVNALAMHPEGPSTLYATSSNYVHWTQDGGATWTSYSRDFGSYAPTLVVHPTTGALYAGVINEYVSVSEDHGATWSRFKYGDDNSPTTLALAGAGYNTLIVMSSRHHQFWGDSPAGTLASPVEPVTARLWTQVSNAVAVWGCSAAVAVDRSNPDIVYFGSTAGVIKSTDGGASFELKATGIRGLTPAFLVDPYDGTLYAADTGYGGLFRSTDGGSSWSRDVESMWFGPWTNTLPMAFGPDRVYAANNGNAYLYWIYSRARSGSTWERGEGLWRRFASEGSYVGIVADPHNSGHAYAAHAGPGYYASDTDHYIPYTTDGGQTWSEFCFPGVDGWPTDKPRISSIALEHDETAGQSTLYAALRYPTRLLRRMLGDPSAQWEQVSLTGVDTSSDISRILIPSPGNIYLVDYLKRLYRSTDGGTTWSQITGSALPRDYLADSSALAFSPTDPLQGYARARSSSSSAGEIYSTSDGGANWEQVTREGLSDEVLQELRYFAVDAYDPFTLYAASRGSGWKLTIVELVNDPPVANDDSSTVDEGGTVTKLDGAQTTVLHNDTDPDPGDTLTVHTTPVTPPSHGTLTLNADGTFSYTHDGSETTSDSFVYEACDTGALCDSATVTIDVTPVNDPPVANDDSATTDEDTPVVIDVTANDTDVDGTIDPTSVSIITAPSSGSVSVDPATGEVTYTPNLNFFGTDTFEYQVCDDDGACDTAWVTVTVNDVNDAPVAYAQTVTTDEDTPVLITLTASDVDDGTLTYTIVDEPTYGTLSGTAPNVTYTPAENYHGPDSFTFKANDGELDSNEATVNITVNPVNDAPVVTAAQPGVTADEGQVATNSGAVSDVDGNAVTLSASVGTVINNGDGTWSWNFTTSDGPAETQAVTISADDGNGGTSQTTFDLSVNNVAPTATFANTTGTVIVGGTATLAFSNQFDPSGPDTTAGFLYSYDCTNDGTSEATDSAIPSFPCPYNSAGTFTARGRIKDKDGGFTDYTVEVVVIPPNRPPLVIPNNSTVTADEGQTATNSGTVSDPDGDPVMLSASVGTVTNNGDGTWSWSFTTTDGPAESQTVTITADDGTDTSQTTFDLTVNNIAPSVDAISVPLDPVAISEQPVNASATFSDPVGSNDEPYSCTVNYGDGSGDQPGSVSGGTCTGPDHTYASPGVYVASVIVTDKDGGSGSATATEFIVIYDPEGGFVTGGGWINSPPGACRFDACTDDTTGKANFGFVSKYKKGADTPTGETEFQFKAGNLNFHSDSYEWLVVAGHKAMYKGVGTINGSGNYGFMLSAIDEKLTPSTDVDLFRIKIWDKENDDAIVYDNQMGDADDADPTTEIGGGSIVIHKQ
jgi:VCBS repeat-containing protein